MNPFQYSDEKISEGEFMISLPSVIIGVAVLTLPSEIAKVTLYSDGWISILLAGIIFTVLAILGVKVALLYPNQSFLAYTSILVTKPVAIGLVIINFLIAIFLNASSLRSVAYISQQYLFEHTPMEVLAFSFLLVVVYAVSGSRAGIFRLNVLFLPIILFVFLFVGFFNITWLEASNYLPMFQSSLKDYMNGVVRSFQAFIGFGIVLFYVVFIHKPKQLTKKVVIGMSIPTVFYIMIFLLCIGVFGNAVTGNLEVPTIELAKRVDIPGGIFERIDALVFTIWIMALFNTAAITLDIAVLLLSLLLTKINKRIITFILAPIVYYFSMFPQQVDQVHLATRILSQFTVYFTCVMIIGLFFIAKIRGVKSNVKK